MDLIFGDASGIVNFSIRLVIWEIIIKSCYKMKNDAMKRTAGRPRSQIDHNLKGKRTVEIITEETGESPKQVQRYITLTNLIPELLQQLDDELISFNPAVELAALKENEQKELIEAMDYAQSVPSLSGTKDEETE